MDSVAYRCPRVTMQPCHTIAFGGIGSPGSRGFACHLSTAVILPPQLTIG